MTFHSSSGQFVLRLERPIAYAWEATQVLVATGLTLALLAVLLALLSRRFDFAPTANRRRCGPIAASSVWSTGPWPEAPPIGTEMFLLEGGPLAVLTPDGPVVVVDGSCLRVRSGVRPVLPSRGTWLAVQEAGLRTRRASAPRP